MKSFVACVLLLTLVGAGLCARLRREAPAEAAAGGPPDGAVNGPPAGADAPEPVKIDGLEWAIHFMEQKEAAETDPEKKEDLNVKIDVLKEILDFQKGAAAEYAAPPPAPEA